MLKYRQQHRHSPCRSCLSSRCLLSPVFPASAGLSTASDARPGSQPADGATDQLFPGSQSAPLEPEQKPPFSGSTAPTEGLTARPGVPSPPDTATSPRSTPVPGMWPQWSRALKRVFEKPFHSGTIAAALVELQTEGCR